MEHLFNPRLLFALLVFVIWAFRAVKAAVDKAASVRENRPMARGPHGEPIDPEAEAREEAARRIAQRQALMTPGRRPGAVGRVAPNPPKAAPAVPPQPDPVPRNELESIPEEPPFAQPARPELALRSAQPVGLEGARYSSPPEPPEVAVYPPLVTSAALTAAPLVLPPLVTGFSAAPVMATAALSAAWSDTARAADRERWSATSGRASARVTLEDLRDPAAVRQAVLLREILGPPVGLR